MTIPEAQPIALAPEKIPLDVVYEDSDLLVINKPSGMLTHPTGKVRTGTLVNALLAHCGDSLSGINGMIRPGIVHRLDRDTSGLLVVAKNDQAHMGLSAQLKDRSMKRTYKAIVQGKFTAPSGTVDAPIGRHTKQRDKMMVCVGKHQDDGRPAKTHWQVLETAYDKFALIELNLETGRTHQIRVHLAHINHPVVGDPMYGSGVENVMNLHTRGQLLQAVRLRFVHPASGEVMAFEVPDDAEMTAVWQRLARI